MSTNTGQIRYNCLAANSAWNERPDSPIMRWSDYAPAIRGIRVGSWRLSTTMCSLGADSLPHHASNWSMPVMKPGDSIPGR